MTSRRHRHGSAHTQASIHTHTHTHTFKGHTSSFPLPAMAAPPHERSEALIPMLINNCINYAARNNMHFIFFPSLCLCHLCPYPLPSHPPSSLLSLPCPLCFILYLYLFFTLHIPSVCSTVSPFVFLLFLFLDLQSCLICVARRVPMKERPMLPTHESFTTRQDLQGT